MDTRPSNEPRLASAQCCMYAFAMIELSPCTHARTHAGHLSWRFAASATEQTPATAVLPLSPSARSLPTSAARWHIQPTIPCMHDNILYIYEWFKVTQVCAFFQKKKYVLVIYLFPVSGHISDDRYTCNGNVINRLIARQETDASLYTSWLWLIDTTKQLTWTDAYDKQFVVLHQQNCVLYNLITILLLVLIWGYNEDTMLILIIYTKKYKSYNPTQ